MLNQTQMSMFEDVQKLPNPKRVKSDKVKVDSTPSSIICNFVSQEGLRAGPAIDLPSISSSKQLEQLVNTLLGNDEQVKIL